LADKNTEHEEAERPKRLHEQSAIERGDRGQLVAQLFTITPGERIEVVLELQHVAEIARAVQEERGRRGSRRIRPEAHVLVLDAHGDRKSTRLNSSYVQISY